MLLFKYDQSEVYTAVNPRKVFGKSQYQVKSLDL